MHFTWERLRDLLVLFVGGCIVVALVVLNGHMAELNDITLENRVAVCRITRAMDLPFDPDGPCARREVRERLEELASAFGR